MAERAFLVDVLHHSSRLQAGRREELAAVSGSVFAVTDIHADGADEGPPLTPGTTSAPSPLMARPSAAASGSSTVSSGELITKLVKHIRSKDQGKQVGSPGWSARAQRTARRSSRAQTARAVWHAVRGPG